MIECPVITNNRVDLESGGAFEVLDFAAFKGFKLGYVKNPPKIEFAIKVSEGLVFASDELKSVFVMGFLLGVEVSKGDVLCGI